MSKNFAQFNEADRLQSVVIGRWKGYRAMPEYIELVNEEQKKGLPSTAELKQEFDSFRQVLEKYEVEVFEPAYVGKFVYDQLTPRDIAVVIGRKLVLCNMAKSSRRYESAGLFSIFKDFKVDEPNVLIPPFDCLLEGGDIIVDRGRILVGISERTNLRGVDWLRRTFQGVFEVVPLHLKKPEEGENVLHLDCAFNPVGEQHALIYEEGFKEIPGFLQQEYQWIKVNREEQQALATNVLSVSKKILIVRDHLQCVRINQLLSDVGLIVEEVKFDAAPSTGGSFRCCSLPLIRKNRASLQRGKGR